MGVAGGAVLESISTIVVVVGVVSAAVGMVTISVGFPESIT